MLSGGRGNGNSLAAEACLISSGCWGTPPGCPFQTLALTQPRWAMASATCAPPANGSCRELAVSCDQYCRRSFAVKPSNQARPLP